MMNEKQKTMNNLFKRIKNPQSIINASKTHKQQAEFDLETKHELDLIKVEKVLKEFDLNTDYGPNIGISRSARYERARNFGKEIKEEVETFFENKELLTANPELDFNLWHDIENIL